MKNKEFIYKTFLLLLIVFGALSPFIDTFVVIEMFYLLIPFTIIIASSIIIFLINLIRYKGEIFRQNSTYIIIIIPIFLLSQIASVFVIDKIQNFRSERIIHNLETQNQNFPESFNTTFGIKYEKIKNKNEFKIEYSRGFFVREIYSSKTKSWESLGWND